MEGFAIRIRRMCTSNKQPYGFSTRRCCDGWASADVNKSVSTPHDTEELHAKQKKEMQREPWWVPHPKSGIFHPEGQHKLIEDVGMEYGLSQSGHTYWHRSFEADHTNMPPHNLDL